MFERIRLLDGLAKSVAVLNVASIVANPGVKNIVQGIFPQKQATQVADAFSMFIVHPHAPKICYRIYNFLFFFEFFDKLFIVYAVFLSYIFDLILILFDEGNDGFPIVFWNVFSLVL